jgi:hypothetical protein
MQQTHLHGTRPDRVTQILYIWVRHHFASKIPQSPFDRSDPFTSTQFAQQARLFGFHLFLIFPTKVCIGRDGGGAGELGRSLFGFR